jgi:uncharacterized LabA/DUF88 family protein
LLIFGKSAETLRKNNLNLKVMGHNLLLSSGRMPPQSKFYCPIQANQSLRRERASPLFANNALVNIDVVQIKSHRAFYRWRQPARSREDARLRHRLQAPPQEFEGRGSLLRAFYYTAVIEDQEYSSLRPLTDWLSYNGYTVVTKAVKEFTDAGGRRKVKGSMHVELAVDAMDLAGQIDQMVLFSGDGDFRALVEAIQRRGVRVTVISTISSQPPMIADELRRQADVFTDLVELQSNLARDPSGRPARAASGAAVPALHDAKVSPGRR